MKRMNDQVAPLTLKVKLYAEQPDGILWLEINGRKFWVGVLRSTFAEALRRDVPEAFQALQEGYEYEGTLTYVGEGRCPNWIDEEALYREEVHYESKVPAAKPLVKRPPRRSVRKAGQRRLLGG